MSGAAGGTLTKEYEKAKVPEVKEIPTAIRNMLIGWMLAVKSDWVEHRCRRIDAYDDSSAAEC